MKTASINAASAFLFATGACRKVYNQSVTVVKDRMDVFLEYDGKSYVVSNSEMLDEYENGTTLTATFMQANECNGSAHSDIVCMMLRESEGWIRVQSIH
jgi:hypothetical protein